MIKMPIFILLIIMTILGSVASLFLKRASNSDGIKKLIMNYNLYVGGVLYVLAAIINIFVLRFLNYSVVLPLTSMTYIWTMVISYFYLKEAIGLRKIFGVSLIVIGCVFVVL